jgi:hypothetical protein
MLPPSFDTNVALDAHVSWVVPPLVQHNMLLPLPVQGDVRALDAALADAATLLATLQLDVRFACLRVVRETLQLRETQWETQREAVRETLQPRLTRAAPSGRDPSVGAREGGGRAASIDARGDGNGRRLGLRRGGL